jgi:hypothetical protein
VKIEEFEEAVHRGYGECGLKPAICTYYQSSTDCGCLMTAAALGSGALTREGLLPLDRFRAVEVTMQKKFFADGTDCSNIRTVFDFGETCGYFLPDSPVTEMTLRLRKQYIKEK